MSRAETSHSVLCLYYNACRDDVLTGCLGFVMIWKFPQAQTDPLFPTQRIECPAIHPDYWVTWIKVDKSSRQLLLNCEEAMIVLDERSYELKYNFNIDLRHSLPFTACAFYHPSCYFITGSKDYAVKVWNTSLNQCPLVTSFCGHCRAITALEVDIPHHLVISSSTDKTIRLWCLETFALTYVLETGEEVHHMELMTSRRLFYQSDEHIRVWNLNHFHTLFTVLGFEIVTSRRVVSRGFPTRLLLHGKDGAIRIVSPSDGTIITTMFPLQTLPEGIADYAYNPREDRLYVVLTSGAILVFNTRTNPCSAYQLWKTEMFGSERVTSTSFAETYGVSCVAMMNIDERTADDEIYHYTLLFAGLNNGHITLVYSNESSMHDTIEAHYGKIALLRVSEGLEQNRQSSLYSAILVSCGTDCELKVWKIEFRNYSAKIISLELWSYVKLLSIPRDMETIGYTIGLVMDDNALVTCRVNHECERPARSRHSQRDSISRNGLYEVDCFTSTAEEKHSKTITGLSACSTLGLFATSSDDWSVKIWNTEAKLLKEICFEESLRGVCFANTRGDLLVGFQSHISIVPLTNYLPLRILEMLSTMEFPDDIFEHHLPFDPMLAFSYDPSSTPCLPLDLGQRRLLLQQQEERSVKCFASIPWPTLRIPSALFLLDSQLEEVPDAEEILPPPRRYSTTQEQEELDEKIRKFQRSSMSRRSSAMHSPILEDVIARITQSFSSRSDEIPGVKVELSSSNLVEQLRRLFGSDETSIPDNYWPCAPDGYIPNSVVRQRVPPKEVPEHLIPRLLRGEDAKEWIRKTKKKRIKDKVEIAEDYYIPLDDDDELGFFSIFDGYDEANYDHEKKSLLLESSDEEDKICEGEEVKEELDSSEDEEEMKMKWKASTKTTMSKEQMLSNIRARQSMRDKKKVSKKPAMPMIIAAEEEDVDDACKPEVTKVVTSGSHQSPETKSATKEPQDPTLNLPPMLRQVVEQPWFPKASLVEGITVEDIYKEMITLMADCAPLTYGKICDQLLDLIANTGISNEQKEKMLNVVVDNLRHPAAGIRRASIKTVHELRFISDEVVHGIVSCLASGSQDLQKDALHALEQLLGIKDKEALRDLFVKIGILSRSPTPDSDTQEETLTHRLKTRTRESFNLLKTVGDDARVDMNKYIHDWLEVETKPSTASDQSAIPIPEVKVEKFTTRNGGKIKMASSIVSKIKLYKPEPRLSIVDLTFKDSSISSRESSEAEEIASPPIEYTHDLMQKLKRTRAGCNLLSRLGYDETPMYTLNFEVPEIEKEAVTIEARSKTEKRPPSALTGFAYGKNRRHVGSMSSKSEKEWDEFDQDYMKSGGECREKDMASFPDIKISDVSVMSRRSEIKRESDNLVLPKILTKIKANRRNSTLDAFRRRNGRIKRAYSMESPDWNDKLLEWRFRKLNQKHGGQVKQTSQKHPEASNTDSREGEEMKKPARRVTITEASVDCSRRKSILRKLQRKRLEEEMLAGKLLQRHSLSTTTSLRVPTPSEDSLPSPGSTRICEANVQLPKIHIRSKQAERIKTLRDSTGRGSGDIAHEELSGDITRRIDTRSNLVGRTKKSIDDDMTKGPMSDNINRGVLSGDVNRDELSGDITSRINTRLNLAGSTKTSKDDDTAKRHMSDNINLEVLSGDINREGLSGDQISGVLSDDSTRGMLSGDMTCTVLPGDKARFLTGTNVPYSLCTDVFGERLSQGTSVLARRPLDGLGMKNEALRVLPVNPKLTIDTGCSKWGRSRYGILEVVWTTRGIYDTQDTEGSMLVNQNRTNLKTNEPTPHHTKPIVVKKLLKPIGNRNLVTNPYTEETEQFIERKRRKLPCVSEALRSVTSNSDSSRQRFDFETECLCTVRELLDSDNYCSSRSN
ncbi:uncharacterized protein LOC114530891 isoform X2 [Dendronephthya gigantea]|uniref:uncharacterized protein LOC114530891 isoform X2 n=1 Tax=Dendronephthya gigantea TaxID=151771 RepID=UPI00106C2C01|nr:uncharacterized protein LOC114530891 isoform X2 [Dendronephthya gigantea]